MFREKKQAHPFQTKKNLCLLRVYISYVQFRWCGCDTPFFHSLASNNKNDLKKKN